MVAVIFVAVFFVCKRMEKCGLIEFLGDFFWESAAEGLLFLQHHSSHLGKMENAVLDPKKCNPTRTFFLSF